MMLKCIQSTARCWRSHYQELIVWSLEQHRTHSTMLSSTTAIWSGSLSWLRLLWKAFCVNTMSRLAAGCSLPHLIKMSKLFPALGLAPDKVSRLSPDCCRLYPPQNVKVVSWLLPVVPSIECQEYLPVALGHASKKVSRLSPSCARSCTHEMSKLFPDCSRPCCQQSDKYFVVILDASRWSRILPIFYNAARS